MRVQKSKVHRDQLVAYIDKCRAVTAPDQRTGQATDIIAHDIAVCAQAARQPDNSIKIKPV